LRVFTAIARRYNGESFQPRLKPLHLQALTNQLAD